MADNTPIQTPDPVGVSIATREIGGAHFQRVIPSNPDGSDASPATQATLAAVLAALGPISTDAGLAAILAKLSSDPATQTTLAAILARVPALVGGAVPVGLAAGELHLGEVGGRKVSVSSSFTRPTDTSPYTAGDAVRNATSGAEIMTLSNVARVNGGSGWIVGARLTTSLKSITPRFRVHLFSDSGPTLSQDNAAFQSLYADASKRLGWFDLPAMSTPSDTTNSTESRSQDLGLRIPFVAGGSTRDIYAVLEALDAFTPANGEQFTLTITADLD